METWSPPVRPESLRERAQWYRDYAKVCAGDNAWALRLAAHFDAIADERERAQPSPPEGRESAAA
jgi:hypothetical protein